MPRQLPPLPALLALEAIIRTGSAANAALDLNITASAISQRIRQLEDWFKCTLFLREGGKMIPTEQASDLYQTCIETFDALEQKSLIMRQQSDESSIRISALPSFAYLVLLPFISRFKQKYPHYDISLETDNRIVDLRAGNIDFAIRYTNSPSMDGLTYEKLAHDAVYPVVSPRLIEQHQSKDLKTLAMNAGLLIDVSCRLADSHPTWDEWLLKHAEITKDQCRFTAFSEYQFAVKSAVDGQGVLLGREMLIQNELAKGELERISEYQTESKAGYYLVTRKDRPLRKSVKEFVFELKNSLHIN